ncbi:hypothetical protein ABPG77_001776 [Micractinium sp. CCAP 211/92]
MAYLGSFHAQVAAVALLLAARAAATPYLTAGLTVDTQPTPSGAAIKAAASGYSSLWGKNGELWKPSGPLPDFSFAGYHQGKGPLPSPAVTKSVLAFKPGSKDDTDMLMKAVDWAHKQSPPKGGYTVLYIPAGTYTLTARLWIKKSNIVIRGAGAGQTILYIPKSLWDLYGKSKGSVSGGYVNWGGFITVWGSTKKGSLLTTATGTAKRGDYRLAVKDASKLKVGQYYDLWWKDVGGKLNRAMFDGKADGPASYVGSTRTRFTAKVVGINGKVVTLERALPYPISSSIDKVSFLAPAKTVEEVGVEGLTFKFKWEPYAGHHCERGWNAIEIQAARDCWVRDIEIINPDSGVLLNYLASSITVTGIKIWYTKTRANHIPNPYGETTDADGHWGLVYSVSYDALFSNFTFTGRLLHDVGTGMGGKWGVFMDGWLSDGNLDLHRGLAGPTLYTNINVGRGSDALSSGGPSRAGPNSVAYSTWWNIRSAKAIDPNHSNNKPGSCSFGTSINLVGVNLNSNARGMCPSWHYERSIKGPTNIYQAQLARRTRRR